MRWLLDDGVGSFDPGLPPSGARGIIRHPALVRFAPIVRVPAVGVAPVRPWVKFVVSNSQPRNICLWTS